MKVLMITPSYAPICGGTETVVSHLSREMVERGHSLAILTFNMKQKWHPSWKMEVTYDQGIKVIKWPALSLISARSPAWVRKLIRKDPIAFVASLPVRVHNAHVLPRPGLTKFMSNYDILHFHDAVDLSFLLFSDAPPFKSLFHCHTLNETIDRYRRSSFSRRLLHRKVCFHICDSSSTRTLLIELGNPPERSMILPCGVDTNIFKPGHDRSEDRLILFAGRVDEKRKGLHVLIQSLSLIDMPVHLVVTGPLENPMNLRTVLANMNKGFLGQHKVDYLGCLQRNELIQWMQKATVFVFPSLSEAFGIVGIEAMACGAPVIGSNTGGIPDFITHNETGILVPPGNPRELAEAIERLLENKPLRLRIAERGYSYVTKHLTWEKVAARLDNVYQDVLGLAPRPDSNHNIKTNVRS